MQLPSPHVAVFVHKLMSRRPSQLLQNSLATRRGSEPPGFVTPPGDMHKIRRWVSQVQVLCKPQQVHWCTGSQAEYDNLCAQLVDSGTFIRLNEQLRPNSYLCRTDPRDVDDDRDSTVVCTKSSSECNETRTWADPEATRREFDGSLAGCMQGRTLFVLPFVLGPVGSQHSQLGIALTDSPYVIVNMMVTYHVGQNILESYEGSEALLRILHSVGAPLEPGAVDVPWPYNPARKTAILPEEDLAIRFGNSWGVQWLAAYCVASLANRQGWISAKSLILSVTGPQEQKDYVCALLPPGVIACCCSTRYA